MKFFRLCRYYYLKFTRLKGDPQSLALGTAIGVLIGLSPTIPFHTILILVITMATRTSAIAAIISSWLVCNPLTYIPIYYFSMVIGNILTPYELNWQRIRDLVGSLTSHQGFTDSMREVGSLGFEAVVVMILGGFVLALPFTAASYFYSLRLFTTLRMRKHKHINS